MYPVPAEKLAYSYTLYQTLLATRDSHSKNNNIETKKLVAFYVNHVPDSADNEIREKLITLGS